MDVLITLTQPKILRLVADAKVYDNLHLYFSGKPKFLQPGERVWMIVRNQIIGFGIAIGVINRGSFVDVEGNKVPAKFMIWVPVKTFTWIKPVPMIGFRGYQYFEDNQSLLKRIRGDWLSEPPIIAKKNNRRSLKKKPATEVI